MRVIMFIKDENKKKRMRMKDRLWHQRDEGIGMNKEGSDLIESE